MKNTFSAASLGIPGPLGGLLFSADGEVRVLTIDPGTGLPVDKGTGTPTLGTANPTDSRFASGLGVGPWGLEFDPRTNDFFVATFRGDPVNSIVQIGGAGFPPPPDTTSTSTTTSSTTSTTTTTLVSGCAVRAVTFASILCRLDALLANVQAAQDLGTTKTALAKGCTAARAKAQAAEGDAAAGRKKPALNALKKSARKLTDFSHRLRSLRSRKRIPAETRAALLEEAAPILEDLKALRKQL